MAEGESDFSMLKLEFTDKEGEEESRTSHAVLDKSWSYQWGHMFRLKWTLMDRHRNNYVCIHGQYTYIYFLALSTERT